MAKQPQGAHSITNADGQAEDKQKRDVSQSFSFRLTSSFAMMAAMTALLMGGVTVIVWNAGRGKLFTENDLWAALIISAVVSVLLAISAGTYFANGIITPIESISKAAERIKNGDLTARTNLTGDDELNQLGATFDEMAESIERDRDLEHQLIGDVAHELRTPLMAIQATVEAIRDGVLPADETRLSTINAETHRLGRLVEALLHLNRLENGTIVAKLKPLNLSETMVDLALNHQMLIEAADLSLEVEIDPEVRIRGDRDLLTQAVANLLSNAVRYTAEGGIIRIQVGRIRGYAEISVSDNGMGISDEDQERVFSRFWRADAARSRASGGLGIGLALVKEVTDQHHGRVTLDSELGVGSTFSILIPLAPDDPSLMVLNDRNNLRRKQRDAKGLRKERERMERMARTSAMAKGVTGALPRMQLQLPINLGKKDDQDK